MRLKTINEYDDSFNIEKAKMLISKRTDGLTDKIKTGLPYASVDKLDYNEMDLALRGKNNSAVLVTDEWVKLQVGAGDNYIFAFRSSDLRHKRSILTVRLKDDTTAAFITFYKDGDIKKELISPKTAKLY